MNLFFIKKFEYLTDESLEDIRERVQSLISRKWYDLSENITGRRGDNGTYVLTAKWTLMYTYWIELSPAYLGLKLETIETKTRIKASLRPNSVLVFSFYLIAVVFLFELFGGTSLEGSKIFILTFLPFFDLILFLLMKMYTYNLKNRFERLMHLELRPT